MSFDHEAKGKVQKSHTLVQLPTYKISDISVKRQKK